MSKLFRAASTTLLLSILVLPTTPASSKASGQAGLAGALTIGQFFQSMESFEKTLENSGHSLLDQGNNIAAQQQLLLAGTLEGLIHQLQMAYKDSLNKTFDGLETQQGNAFKRLRATLEDASRLENRSATDLNNIVLTTQDAANQLMDKMPLTDKSPVYFGMQTKDVLGSFDANPDDIVLTGYHLVDLRLQNKKPDIQIAVSGKTYNITKDYPNNIAAQFNRIQITLPEELKKAIRIDNPPCDPMRLFFLTGAIYYEGGFFNATRTFQFNGNARPGARLYAMTVTLDGSRTAMQPVQASFVNTSGQLNFGCGDTPTTGVEWNAPADATEIKPTSAWVDVSNSKAQTLNAYVSGTKAVATGSITGLDKQCGPFNICNCPGGGHGKLQISGTYVVNQLTTTPFHDQLQQVHVNPTHISIPSDSILTLSTIEIQITRKDCPQVFDTIHIAVPPDHNAVIQATSSKGFFVATLQPGQIDISSTSLMP